jgi:hypothetical protein
VDGGGGEAVPGESFKEQRPKWLQDVPNIRSGAEEMKIRNGFVSNSSSSSFVLNKLLMTEEQIQAVLSFKKDGWNIEEKGEKIAGFTVMDNGYIVDLFKEINIGCRAIEEYEGDGASF